MKRLLFALIIFTGCIRPVKPVAKVLPDDAPVINVRMVRIDPLFSRQLIQDRIDVAVALYSEHGVKIVVKEIVDLDKPEWVDVSAEDLPGMRAWSKTDIQTVYCVRSITYQGKSVGGLGYTRPINCLILSLNSCVDVYAHEQGHGCGLQHLDIDNNTMNGVVCRGYGTSFNLEQGEKLRNCATNKAFAFSSTVNEPFICLEKQ